MAEPHDPANDCFAPPKTACEVKCVHCEQVYLSSDIVWRDENSHPQFKGHWCCPTPDCDGVGFGFDIMPTDLAWQSEDRSGGWSFSDDDDADDWYDKDDDEPGYDEDDDDDEDFLGFLDDDDDDDDESFSWKHLFAEEEDSQTPEQPEHPVLWVKVEPPRAYGNSPRPPYRHHYGDGTFNMGTGEFEDDIPF